jgi:hypothetical protein
MLNGSTVKGDERSRSWTMALSQEPLGHGRCVAQDCSRHHPAKFSRSKSPERHRTSGEHNNSGAVGFQWRPAGARMQRPLPDGALKIVARCEKEEHRRICGRAQFWNQMGELRLILASYVADFLPSLVRAHGRGLKRVPLAHGGTPFFLVVMSCGNSVLPRGHK